MKFIAGEGGWTWLERATYRGGIGFYYDSTLGGVLTYLIVGILCILAIIGFITVIKWLFFGRKKKEDPEKKWMKTGRID